MNRYAVFVIFFISLLGVILLLSAKKSEQVCIGEVCFTYEISKSQEELKRGLSYRDSLVSSHGMLFVFPQNTHSGFWMKDMNFNLDLIFIDSDYGIVDIARNQTPCTKDLCPEFIPKSSYRYVLEINGGLTEKYSIEIGDRVYFK